MNPRASIRKNTKGPYGGEGSHPVDDRVRRDSQE